MGLLDYLCLQIGCLYVSDLPLTEYFSRIVAVLNELPDDKFTMDDWNDAVHYITKQHTTFQTQAQARQFLENMLP